MFALSEIWGNGEVSGVQPLGTCVMSPHAYVCFDTNSPRIMLDFSSLVSTGDTPRMDFIIYRSTTSSNKPVTYDQTVTDIVASGRHRTGWLTLGGSGSQRVWVCSAAKNANTQACIEAVFVVPGSTISRVSPFGPWVGVDGGGSWSVKNDFGYYVSGGVLQGGAFATVRARFTSRLTQMQRTGGGLSGVCLTSVETNDARGATMSTSDYSIALGFMIDDIRTYCPTAALSCITILREKDGFDTAPFRAATTAVCVAKGVSYVSGLDLGAQAFGDADLDNADGIHPVNTGQAKIAAAQGLLIPATGGVLIIGNSIANGYNATESRFGCVPLLRLAR